MFNAKCFFIQIQSDESSKEWDKLPTYDEATARFSDGQKEEANSQPGLLMWHNSFKANTYIMALFFGMGLFSLKELIVSIKP